MRLKTVVNTQQHAGMLAEPFKVFWYLCYTACIVTLFRSQVLLVVSEPTFM